MARPGRSLRISIVGAGNVGTALAVLLDRSGYRIGSIISRRFSSARRLASRVHCRRFSRNIEDLDPATNVILISTPDEAIATVARQIALTTSLDFTNVHVAHTSGLLTSDELEPLERKGATTFSLHPIQTFPHSISTLQHAESWRGISFGVEGSPKARRFARSLVKRLGGRMLEVPKDEKISYHLACVFASNYTVALLGVVQGIGRDVAPLPSFRRLVESSVRNAFELTPQRALSGPIARGSVKAVRRHVSELRRKHQGIEELYKLLGLQALALAKRDRRLPRRTVHHLFRLLKK